MSKPSQAYRRWQSGLFLSLAVLAAGAFAFSTGALAKGPPPGKGGGGGGSGGGGSSGSPSFFVVDLGQASANAVNDVGELVGAMGGGAAYWRLDAQGVLAVPLPEIGAPPKGSIARDINNFGEAVGGQSHVEVIDPVQFVANEALYWRISDTGDASVLALPSPLSGAFVSTEAFAISDTGLIVGRSSAQDETGTTIATDVVVWQVDAQNQAHVFELDSG